MTCIVGIASNGKTYLGGDAAGTDVSTGTINIRLEPKVFDREGYLFGYTTSFRMGGILEFTVPTPTPKPDGTSLRAHLITSWIGQLRDIFKKEGYMTIDKNEESGGTFLVGYHGELCVIHGDFQVGTPKTNYYAVGSDSPYALGSLNTSKHIAQITPRKRVLLALQAASEHNAYVRPPFTIISS